MKNKILLLLALTSLVSIRAWSQADPTAGNTKTPVVRTVESFGAIANDTLDDSKAFKDAADFFSNYDTANVIDYNTHYGVMKLGAGTYILGEQEINTPTAVANGQYARPKYEYLFRNLDGLIIEGMTFNCSGEEVLLTKLKIKQGDHYGYFDPTTGLPQYGDSAHGGKAADPGTLFLLANSAKNVIIRNMEMDGSSDTYIVGRQIEEFGDFNCFSYGINSSAKFLSLDNLYIHNFGTDGIKIMSAIDIRPGQWNVTINQIRSFWNGRQAFSWTDGRDVKVENSVFAFTRLREGHPDADTITNIASKVAGAPGCNVNIEPEMYVNGKTLPIRNGLFNNCKIIGNLGPTASLAIQLNTDSITFNNCEISAFSNTDPNIGVGWAAIVFESAENRNFSFNNCTITGTINCHRQENSSNLPDTGLTLFNHCTIAGNRVRNINHTYFTYALIQTYDRVLFESCDITQTNERSLFEISNKLGISGHYIPSPDHYTTLHNCNVISLYDPAIHNLYPQGYYGRMYALRFTGNTTFTHPLTIYNGAPHHNFCQNITINGSSNSTNPDSFTFDDNNNYKGNIAHWVENSSYDSLYYKRPIIFGETPCEYLKVNIGNNLLGASALRNDRHPLYIGEGTEVRIKAGSSLILSGDVYLAGKIIVENGAYLVFENTGSPSLIPTGPLNLHYLSSTLVTDHIILEPGAITTFSPWYIFCWPIAPYNAIPTTLKSELMAPQAFLRSDINLSDYSAAGVNFECGATNQGARPAAYPVAASHYPQITPNPTNDQIIITIDPHGISHVQLLDQNGKVLYLIKTTAEPIKISLKGYAPGVYLLKYINDKTVVTQKVTKL